MCVWAEHPADIITAIDYQGIDEQNNLVTILIGSDPGQQVQITVARELEETTLDVTLGTR